MLATELPNTHLIDVMLRLDEREENVFALASSTKDGWGNVLCWNPDETFSLTDAQTDVRSTDLQKFVALQQAQDRLVVGYLSYDFGVLRHEVILKSTDDLNMPLVFVASFSNWISFENNDAVIHGSGPSYIELVHEIMQREARLLAVPPSASDLEPVMERTAYQAKYRKIKEYIKAGDVYQVNLTHRLEGNTSQSSRDLFCHSHQSSRADFQSYIEGENYEILSFSPERFVKVEDGTITTSPIKGTRPRGASSEEDRALRSDLQTNQKDRAELDMITDLLRNDIGAVSKPGSVVVNERRIITAYPTLWHAHSSITANLLEEVSPIDALLSLMPGGSVTGCPKKRAMEVIDELEPTRRGVYTGSIFTVSPVGELDSNIAIRTIIKKGAQLYLSVGGGIVQDSVEKDEYQESIDKAASFMQSHARQRLSSDILEQQFGPTEIEILHQDKTTRIICTKTTEDQKILELSRVVFVAEGVALHPAVHQDILNGTSMGKAFRSDGTEFNREVRSAQKLSLPSKFTKYFKSEASATVVNVRILVGPNRVPYADIIEVYSPDVAWPSSPQVPDNTQKVLKDFAEQLP